VWGILPPRRGGQPLHLIYQQDLGFNWIWLDFYVDSGPSPMSWDQVVVAKDRIGCLTPAQ